MTRLDSLHALLGQGRDSALLRYSLGQEYLAAEDAAAAIVHLQKAIELDPQYSAAFKSLGKAYAASGDRERAKATYRRGIAVAEERGDKQAAKEMGAFLRRLDKPAGRET